MWFVYSVIFHNIDPIAVDDVNSFAQMGEKKTHFIKNEYITIRIVDVYICTGISSFTVCI